MLTGVGHDLRTPLTVIKVQAQLARRRAATLTDDAGITVVKGLDQIERAASRMAHWIDELLDVSRVQRPEDIRLERSRIDLVVLARQAIEEHQQNTNRHVF